MLQIFIRFLSLGLISFGGPAAHIGYFRQTFVQELAWLDEKKYASLVALSQFMPGPSSSQVGFAIGYHKGGIIGGLAAFLGFTLPSFILLFLCAVTSYQWLDFPLVLGVIHGLKLLAVIVVADAVWIMFNQFCNRRPAILLMLLSFTLVLLFPSIWIQFSLLFLAAIVGRYWLPTMPKTVESSTSRIKFNYFWLSLFTLIFVGSIFVIAQSTVVQSASLLQVFVQFYQAGSMVFGGGHVVLPVLQSSVGDSISNDQFLTGYALAQAIPGPMFTLAAYLGAQIWITEPIVGALVATLAIFLPGFLLILVALKSWHALIASSGMTSAIAGVNAAVVGFLLSALYHPIFTSAVLDNLDMALVVIGFGLFKIVKPNVFFLVLSFGCVGGVLA